MTFSEVELERKRAYQRAWAKKNPERIRASKRRYMEKNKERVYAQRKAWRVENREKVNAAKRKWETENPEKHAMQRVRTRLKNQNGYIRRSLSFHYDITMEAYDSINKIQGGLCAICRTRRITAKSSRLFVDHDHEKGHVRGLLCHYCNAGLGYFNERIDVLKRAISYLDEHQEAKEGGDWVARAERVFNLLPNLDGAEDV